MNWGIRRTPAWKKRTIALYCSAALVTAPLMSNAALATDYTGTAGGTAGNASFSGSTNTSTNGGGGSGGANGSGGAAPSGGGTSGNSSSNPGGNGGAADAGGSGGRYFSYGGSGGGGGAGGAGFILSDGSMFTSSGTIAGGAGGGGGAGVAPYNSLSGIGGGGGGGGGGSGIIVLGSGTITNSNGIAGGTGGFSGSTSYNQFADQHQDGQNGAGGHGINAASSTGVTIYNSGTITGGDAGSSAFTTYQRTNVGGAGIYGQNITLYNTGGTITGGYGNTSAAAAIELTGGTNSVNLSGGSVTSLTYGDAIRADSGSNTFNIVTGGAITLAQNGIGLHVVNGTNTLTLSGGNIVMGQAAVGIQADGGNNTFNLTGGSLSLQYNPGPNTYASYNYGIVVNGGSSTFNVSAGTIAAGGGTSGIENSAVLLNSGTTVFNFGGSANITNAAYSDLVDITGGTNTLNISGGTITHGNQGYPYSIKVSGGTNILNITGGMLDPIYLGGGTNTLEGGGFSSGITLAGGATAKVVAAGTDVAGITSFDNYGSLTVEDGRSIAMSSFTNENGATLTLGTGATLVSSSLNLVAGSTITGAGSLSSGASAYSLDSGSISASLAGTGGLNKTGSGILTLTGANSYTGGTNITGGTLSIAAGALGGGDVHMAQGTTIQFTGSSFTTHNNFYISGDPVFDVATGTFQTIDSVIADDTSASPVVPGVVEKTGGGTLVLSGANTYSGGTIVSNGGLMIGSNSVWSGRAIVSSAIGTGALTLDGATVFINAGRTLYNDIYLTARGGGFYAPYALQLFGNIADAATPATFALSGTGPIYLGGSNSYASATYIGSGTEVIFDQAASASANSDFTVDGTLDVREFAGGTTTIKSLSGSGTVINDLAGNGTLTIAIGNGQTATFNGTISDNGGGNPHLGIEINGLGTQKFAGANSYSGGTTLNSGTLEIGNAGALGSGTVTFNGGTLKADGAYTIANAIQLAVGDGTFASGGNNTTFSGNVTDGGTPGMLALTGGGTFTFTGSNNFSGGLSVASGTLIASGASNIGSGDITLGSGVKVTFDTVGTTYANNFKLTGSNIFNVDPTGAGLNQAFSGVISDATATPAALRIVSDATALSRQPGTVTLSGANTYTGGTYSYGMGLIANNDSAFGAGTLTLDAAYLQTDLSTLTLANNIAVTSTGGSIQANGKTIILDGVIGDSGGAGRLTLSNNVATGQIVLNGANTLSGNTAINMADVVAGSSGAFGTGTVELYNGATLEAAANTTLTISNAIGLRQSGGASTILGNGTTLTLSGAISDEYGAGALIVGAGGSADTSTVVLSGANSFSGGLTIAGGTAEAAGSTSFGAGAVVMQAGTTLAYDNGVTIANPLQWTGDANLDVATGTAEQHGDLSDDSPASPYTVTKTGAGTLVLSGSNSSSSDVKLAAGTLEIGNFNALGGGTYIFDGGTLKLDSGWAIANNFQVLSGGTLDTNGNNIELDGTLSSDPSGGALTIIGAGSVQIAGVNNLSGGAALGANTELVVAGASGTGAGDVTMADTSAIHFTTTNGTFTNHFVLDGTGTFNVDSGRTAVLSGVIADGGSAGTLKASGPGTLVLSGANTYSGGTVISGGTVLSGNASAFGTGPITLDGGALGWNIVYPPAVSAITNDIVLTANGGTIIGSNSAGSISGSMLDDVIGGVISGTGQLTIQSAGSDHLHLTGANTYTGGTVIGAGSVVYVGNSAAFGTNTMQLGDNAALYGSGTLNIANAITVGAGSKIGTTTGADLTLSGVISDGASRSSPLIFINETYSAGTGIVRLTGANTYTGETAIYSQTVEAGNNAAFGTSTVALNGGSVLKVVDGVTLNNSIILGGLTPVIGVDSGVATLSGDVLDNSYTSSGFTKTGAGTLVLTGSNNYTGGTSVQAGTLEIGAGASIVSSGTYDIATGAQMVVDSGLGALYLGALSGDGSLTSHTGTQLNFGGAGANSDDTTFSGVITAPYLAYDGTGTLTLTGSGSAIDQLIVCGCTSSGGITLSGGSLTAAVGVGVSGQTFTVTDGAQLTTPDLEQSGGTIAISGASTVVNAANTGSGMIAVYTNGALSAFTISGGAQVSTDSLVTGQISGTDVPQLTVTGTGTSLTVNSGAQLNGGTVLTVADGATLTTPSIDLDTGASLSIGNGGTVGIVGNASTRIQGLSTGTMVATNFTGDGTLDAFLTGALALNVQSGSLTLTNALNDYSGGTSISTNGVLILQDSSAGTGAIVNNGFLAISNSAPATFAYSLSGAGGLAQIGTGALTISTAQVYTGRTVIGPASTLFLTGAGDLSRSSAIEADGTFDVSGVAASNVSITSLYGDGDVETGSKTLIITGNGGAFSGILSDGGAHGGLTVLGDQILNGIISLTGTTTIGAGATLTVSGPDALGGSALDFKAGSTLKFEASGTYANAMTFAVGAPVFDVTGQAVTLSGVLAGPGDLAVTGTGSLTLTNTGNSYAGGTEVYGGSTLRADADGELGGIAALQLGNATSQGTLKYAGAFALASGRVLTVNAGGGAIDTNGFDVTIASVISGSGALTKTGTGMLTLTGSSSFSGATTVSSGTLSVNGSLASSAVTVASGARLGGSGTVGATAIASGGTIAPGNSIGTLHVNGDLALAAGSTTAMEISPAAADQIAVSGTAALNGTLAFTQGAGSYAAGTDFKLITASNVTGVFSSVTGLNITGLNANVTYSATSVDLQLTGTGGGGVSNSFLFGSYGTTANQIAAGNALAAGANSGALYAAMGTVVASSRDAVPGALGQLAGDLHASQRGAAIEDSRLLRDALLARIGEDADSPRVWAEAFGGYGSIAGDGNAGGVHHDGAGFIAGGDLPVAQGLRLGAAAAYQSSSARSADRTAQASGDSGHILGYAGWRVGAIDLRLGGDYGWGGLDMTRAVTALSQSLASHQDQALGQVFFRGGWRVETQQARLEPYAGITHVAATSGAFAETGGSAALTGGEKTDSETFMTLGLRAVLPAAFGDTRLSGWSDIGWEHAFNTVLPLQALTLQDAGQGFAVAGAPLDRDTASVQAGVDLAIAADAALRLGYDGSFGTRAQSHAIRGGVMLKF